MIKIPDGLRRPAEIERDELKKQLAELRALVEQMKAAIVWVCGDCEALRLHKLERYMKNPCDDCPCKLALEAAERAAK